MNKRIFIFFITLALAAALLCSCTKKEKTPEAIRTSSEETEKTKEESPGKETEKETERDSETEKETEETLPSASDGTKSREELEKEAENTAYTSGKSIDSELYGDDARLSGVAPAFIQVNSLEDFESFDSDEKFFSPVSEDYLIASFEPGKTVIYEFFHDGSLIAVRGRIVYDSEEELLAENSDKVMEADKFGKNSYTWHDNVLYYIMSQEALFASEMMMDKTKLLKTASQGLWDDFVFWFSKPYDDELAQYDEEKWTKVLDTLDRQIPEGADVVYEDEPDEGGQGSAESGNLITEEEVRRLFEEKMEAAGRSPAEYENSEVIFLMNRDDMAYATLYCYTVPEDYTPGGKIENLTASGPILYNHDTEFWEVSNLSEFMADYQDEYYEALLSEEAYDAYCRGDIVRRFWIPFPKEKPFVIPGIVFGKVLEIYETGDGDLAVTVFFSNETDEDVIVTTLESLKISDENGVVADVGADLGDVIYAGECFGETLIIPADYLRSDYSAGMAVEEFLFTTESY